MESIEQTLQENEQLKEKITQVNYPYFSEDDFQWRNLVGIYH